MTLLEASGLAKRFGAQGARVALGWLAAVAAVSSLAACRGGGAGEGGGASGGGGAGAPKEIDIALVTKAMDSELWLVLADGARAAAAAHPGVKLAILAPDREINIDQQVSCTELVTAANAAKYLK